MQPTLDTDILNGWVGRRETRQDVILPDPARRMQAMLDQDPTLSEGEALPPLWHWLYFLEVSRMSALGRDGHSARGGFLPPVALPRRMWAGGRFRFVEPVRIGEAVDKSSEITSVRMKDGKTGPLCFVTVRHELSVEGAPRLSEEHDIVYRADPDPDAPAPAAPHQPGRPEWSGRVTPSPVLLFRYSALTFNGHRIHYDVDYCRKVEGYPGLVFHGPLTATLLIHFAEARAGRAATSFSFRATHPLFDTAAFTLNGRADDDALQVWAATPQGGLAMEARAEF